MTAVMDQGPADFICAPEPEAYAHYLQPLNLATNHIAAGFPLEVVSTGLPYLLVPIASGLEQARILVTDYESRLAQIGAKFAYVFDINAVEGRTWDNAGMVEDVATGQRRWAGRGLSVQAQQIFSRAGNTSPAGAFCRPRLKISIRRDKASGNMLVSGQVRLLVRGECLLGM